MNPSFSSLGLGSEIVAALTEQGYETPTPIQAAAIPKALAGHDLLAAAQTGTGKTAAFMLPGLERLKRYATPSTSPAMHPVRMLVLTPTRELADQIDQNVQGYIKNLPLRHTVLFGGVNMDKQTAELRAGCEIVVATVGRLLDHVKQKNIHFNKVEIVVLDEADRMLDMGFIDDIRNIMQMLPKQRQTLLFSATFSPPIRKLAQDFMHHPEQVEVAAQNAASANVEQHVIAVDTARKRNLLERLIVDLHMNQVIVFCKTKQSVDQVTRDLQRRNLSAQALHGDKSQQTRLETLGAFKEGTLRVLVATDVAARGLDIAELPFVINYEMPTQPEDYVHRIGRTGRAGSDGVAISLMDEHEQNMFEAIKELTRIQVEVERIEGFEPSWWQQNSAAAPRTDRERGHRLREQKNRDTRSRSDNRSESPAARNDPGAACGKIAGRARRSRRERQTCALLQPNYGA
ncbi:MULTISPECIES: DEAD/DEAH box helicase [Neisseria]|uniref:DEAD-box ATP-dependent RNA helicase RhpA n=1 Tax=Neisseria musculi TaxID=1815583 RepID=A0A7H1MCF8_9NEIS|nr:MULTISPECIES: DEAD/DEAH box helicase [Neisseria]MBF0803819.1 DEAD/DEAH box helicase [Neisseria sp. 19428wB4_WF04]QNT59323.1 DEAD/DEAH box helicase family protein [Neisseria musculi]TFU43487.1 DEAD/DEAH box helicase [Neisseria sp. WF04]